MKYVLFILIFTFFLSNQCFSQNIKKPFDKPGNSRDIFDRKEYYFKPYNDKYYGEYGFDPVPPNFKIGPGLKPGHSWRFGFDYYGKSKYDPGYDGIIWFGYCLEW